MKWNKKYIYPTSVRSNILGTRHYNVANQLLPSCTSILELTKSQKEKDSLANWVAKVGKQESSEYQMKQLPGEVKCIQQLRDFYWQEII